MSKHGHRQNGETSENISLNLQMVTNRIAPRV